VSDVHVFGNTKKRMLARPKAGGLEQNRRSLGTGTILIAGALEEIMVVGAIKGHIRRCKVAPRTQLYKTKRRAVDESTTETQPRT
jgi:hypothetical protein